MCSQWVSSSEKTMRRFIHVDKKPAFGNHVMKGVIHETLECGREVGQAEEHDIGFKEAFVGSEGSFPLVAIFDADIIIAPTNVKLDEGFGIFELINEVGDERKGVGILDSMFI